MESKMKLLNKKWMWISLCVLLVSHNVYSQQETPASLVLTLCDALRMTDERNVNVIIANERVTQAIARIGTSRSTFLPQIKASASETRQTRDLRSSGINLGFNTLVGPFNSFDGRVRLTQTIFDPAALKRLQAARDGQSLSFAEYEKVKEDVLALVANMFIEARRAHDSLTVSDAVLKRDAKHRQIAQDRLRLGSGSEIELSRAEADYQKSLFQKKAAETESLERSLDLSAALGFPKTKELQLVWDENFKMPLDLKSFPNLENHPAIQVAQKQLDQSKSQALVQKGEYLPKISVSGDYGSSGVKPTDASETYALGVQATMPIFEGGLRQSNIKEAESIVKTNEANLQDVERYVEADIAVNRQLIDQAKMLINQKDAELAVAQKQFQLSQDRLKSGIGNEVEFLDAQAMLANAQDQKEEAKAVDVLAQINYLRALGRLEEVITKGAGQ